MPDKDLNPTEAPTPETLHGLYVQLSDRVDSMADALTKNTELTAQIKSNTSDLVDLFTAARGAFKVLEGLGKIARPLMYISAVISAAVAAYKTYRGLS